jgi:hypothetical protein
VDRLRATAAGLRAKRKPLRTAFKRLQARVENVAGGIGGVVTGAFAAVSAHPAGYFG